MFLEDMAVMGFGLLLLLVLLALLPMLFTGMGSKVAPGFALMFFLFAALVSAGWAAAAWPSAHVPHAPAEEQMLDAPPR